MRQIRTGELAIGMPLPWDVYGDGGGLLARKGYQIANDNQIASLMKRGLVADEPEQAVIAQPPSVLRILNDVNKRLMVALTEIATGRAADARAQLSAIAVAIAEATDLQTEVALACILHNQDAGPYAVRHSVDTAVVSLVVARGLGKPPEEIMTVILAALTMNVGMLAHQERMQSNRAKLTDAEMAIINAHPEASVAMLRKAGVNDPAWLAAVLMHHENENGTGYPNGRQAEEIPDAAKIISLADRYCARVSSRSYRPSMVPNAALRDLMVEGRTTIHAQLTAAFIRELGVYPIGTFVRLQNGEIGVVTRKGMSTTTPIVLSLVGPRGAPLDVILRRDTQDERHAIREVLSAEQAAIGFNLDQLWGSVASV